MSDQIVDGPAIIRVPDVWSLARWRRQIDGPRQGWRSLRDAFAAATIRHRDQVDELIPQHWAGVSAEQYQRYQQQFYICAEHVCVYGDEVSFSLDQIGQRLDSAGTALSRMYQEIAMRVPSRRLEEQIVEFRVTNDLQARRVYEAVAAARQIHQEVGVTVRDGVTRIRHSTQKLEEYAREGDQVSRFLPRASPLPGDPPAPQSVHGDKP
jgi:uncharacterized protein YukE